MNNNIIIIKKMSLPPQWHGMFGVITCILTVGKKVRTLLLRIGAVCQPIHTKQKSPKRSAAHFFYSIGRRGTMKTMLGSQSKKLKFQLGCHKWTLNWFIFQIGLLNYLCEPSSLVSLYVYIYKKIPKNKYARCVKTLCWFGPLPSVQGSVCGPRY